MNFHLGFCLLLICLFIRNSIAFDFFNMFNGPDEAFQKEEQFVKKEICKDYICPLTHTCVEKPIDCPCENELEKKCIIGDWYICISSKQSCENFK
ncbi:hypothetical protein BCR32DRAFT_279412 [Anaeromyces robustus]|uniref:Long chronological lifespan protein 2 n=1 Tax=Anaeromyces robustus TaxID=1754192 RepID=A0A1Y1X7T4_9FUNG|nr:hypothetical protein BCR32DRAFT_279412 [Anaeromyces robustus]|eukprot:ORX81821.1 hypothetical protein BCR32DRAFT_279412 [Anaeromyces robustus]